MTTIWIPQQRNSRVFGERTNNVAIVRGPICLDCGEKAFLKELQYPTAYWWCSKCQKEVYRYGDSPEHSLKFCAECRGTAAHHYLCRQLKKK
jgi:hypothetical protein